jgi:hypothetical protein
MIIKPFRLKIHNILLQFLGMKKYESNKGTPACAGILLRRVMRKRTGMSIKSGSLLFPTIGFCPLCQPEKQGWHIQTLVTMIRLPCSIILVIVLILLTYIIGTYP